MADVTIPTRTRRPPLATTVDSGQPVLGSGWIRFGDVTLHMVGLRMLGYWPLVVNYPDTERVLEVSPAEIDATHLLELHPNSRTRWLFVGVRQQSAIHIPPSDPVERPDLHVELRRVSDDVVIDSGFTFEAADLAAGLLEDDLPAREFNANDAVDTYPTRWVHTGQFAGSGARPRLLSIDDQQRVDLAVKLTATHTRVLHVDVWELGGIVVPQAFTP